MARLEALSRILNVWVERTLAALGITMAAVVALQVFFRYVLNHSLFWSEELARYLLVWLTFLGATVAYRRQANPGIDVLTRRLSEPSRKMSAMVVHASALGLFVVMIYFGTEFAHFVRMQISPALGLPKWIPHSIVPISGAILAVHALGFLAREAWRSEDDR